MPRATVPRWRLDLEARAALPDEGGGYLSGWVKIGEVFAVVEAASGFESLLESRQAQRVTHRVTLRSSAPGASARPRADQRFRTGEAILDIRAVFDMDGRGRRLVCLCEEGSPS
ncbi:head-tail adaptor protein [Neomegalonema sp.]|uniref:head-tail adaptor protein n=1 Tax=Neomegalonema sp. TaxID=2039713 RepID=UPI0026379DC1|nr:head-tail adaptor protein [Neomegalonema sp.]MDD2869097.1 head-tail adaptor protein [Neomegalonema sp.]